MAEAITINTDMGGIIKFDAYNNVNTIATRWTRWRRSFELFAQGKGVANPNQKKALLLHSAGIDVQDIFHTLTLPEPVGDEDVYDTTLRALNEYFAPQLNITFERSQFRAMFQLPTENVNQFITRLRQKAVYCNFHNIDENIRDQVIEKTTSHRLRRKVLERNNVTLQQLIDLAQSLEISETRATTMEGLPKEQVNKISGENFQKRQSRNNFRNKSRDSSQSTYRYTGAKQHMECHACGREGHFKNDVHCPARGKKCRRCHHEGHFEKKCKTKLKRKQSVRTLQTEEENDESEYLFTLLDNYKKGDVTINVGGVPMSVIIDSGASVNVIDRELWEHLKREKIKCETRLTRKKIYAYGNTEPLKVAGSFTTEVCIPGKQQIAEFYVVEENGIALLGKDTAQKLGILKIKVPQVDLISVESPKEKHIWTKFPELSKGVGKLKDYQLKISIDKSVKPVVQPVRRIPYHLREKLEKKLQELEWLDIIEKVRRTV